MDYLTRMYQIRRTCWQMLRDRGYLVAEVRQDQGAKDPGVVVALLSCVLQLSLQVAGHVINVFASLSAGQSELQESPERKEAFRDKYGDVPNKAELTMLVPRADDPVKKVWPLS